MWNGAAASGAAKAAAAIGVAIAWFIVCALYVVAYGRMPASDEAITDKNTNTFTQIDKSNIFVIKELFSHIHCTVQVPIVENEENSCDSQGADTHKTSRRHCKLWCLIVARQWNGSMRFDNRPNRCSPFI